MKTSKSLSQLINTLLFTSSVLLSWAFGAFALDSPLFQPSGLEPSTSQALITEEVVTPRVNINQANLEQLKTLPGIGKVKAAAIIEYRNEVGLFDSIEQLQQIKGIGTKLYAKLVGKVEI